MHPDHAILHLVVARRTNPPVTMESPRMTLTYASLSICLHGEAPLSLLTFRAYDHLVTHLTLFDCTEYVSLKCQNSGEMCIE